MPESSVHSHGQPPRAAGKRARHDASEETVEQKVACMSWLVSDVVRFLEGLGLAHVTASFQTNAVDGVFLSQLSQEDFVQELGLTPLQAREILARLP